MAINITDLATEQAFTTFHARRGAVRDALRLGVHPNLVSALALYDAFVADYGPKGKLYDEAIWTYYLSTVEPIATQLNALIDAGRAMVDGMRAVESTAPGTLGI